MSKTRTIFHPKSVEIYKNDPLFYEELVLLKAQEKIAELMKKKYFQNWPDDSISPRLM